MNLSKIGSVKATATIFVYGRVQGVGFRPFIYRTATKFGLTGYVTNLRDATVKIVAEGPKKRIEQFLKELREEAPAVADIETVAVNWEPYKARFKRFRIKKSEYRVVAGESYLPPPDVGICDECINDVVRPRSRWRHYPFTCCSHCGPRYTAIYTLPYDRGRTNMADFPLCDQCNSEYKEPSDRRFHAQGICCPKCGPRMTLYSSDRKEVIASNPLEVAAKLIDEGHVVAVKGIGGIHIATKTTEDGPIIKLRERKGRKHQPLAIMSPDLKAVKSYAIVTAREEEVLTSWKKPIVILNKAPSYYLSDLVSPSLDTVGVMLPYTGIHLLLFQHTKEPALVMTSGNDPHVPMITSNEEAMNKLGRLADYLLLHNRRIVMRCDDSVLRVIDGKTAFIRRSRGYVPLPIDIPVVTNDLCIAVGAELRNSAAIAHKGRCCMTQYLGDVENLDTLNYMRGAIDHILSDVLGVTGDADVMACDLHPLYITSQYAAEESESRDITLVRVQHHHAHIASLMAESGVPPGQSVIGIACDGVGYGPDGTVWGGEVLQVDYGGYKRLGHLELQPMPGGDLCTKYPLRMLISTLANHLTLNEVRDITSRYIDAGLPHGDTELHIIYNQARKRKVLRTSSTGRILDAASALFGICLKRTYEGEPAMRLEALASTGKQKHDLGGEIISRNGKYVLNTTKMFQKMINLMKKSRKSDLASSFQGTLARGLADIVMYAVDDTGIDTVGVSGGVFVNRHITKTIREHLKREKPKVRFLMHRLVPPGDGGIAIGQSVISVTSRHS